MSGPTIRAHRHILDTLLYVAGEDSVPGFENPAKLSSNESPLGPSRGAIEAYRNTSAELSRYPDGGCVRLRQALADHNGISPDNIVCSNGSEQLIDMLARAYAGAGDEVIFTEHAFISYRIATQAAGATAVAVPECELRTDVSAILDHVNARTRIVFLANPNNPTGTYICSDELQRLRAGLPPHVLLVIDAAYCEYVDRSDYRIGNDLVDQPDGNTVVLRTFSKIYGLAALRIGWAYCPPDVVEVLNRIRGVFPVSRAAQAAAIAALADTEHTVAAKAYNHRWRRWLTKALRQIGLRVTPSVGNFVLVHFDNAEHSLAADRYLRSQGIILRPVAGYGLPECLRASIGLKKENEQLVAVLRSFESRDGSAPKTRVRNTDSSNDNQHTHADDRSLVSKTCRPRRDNE